MIRPVSKYKKLKKSLWLIIAAVFFLSSFAGEIQSCICEDTKEVITEKESCCNDNSTYSDSEKDTKDSVLENHNCDYCHVCSVTKQKIKQPYNISSNKTTSKEILNHNNESCFLAANNNSKHISLSEYFPDIHTRIFISVSNLRI